MPSPFPGMNPYLERATAWESLHTDLIVAIKAQVAAQLPPEYVIRTENRVYIHEPPADRRFLGASDLGIVRPPGASVERTTTIEAPARVTILDVVDVRQVRFLTIRDRDGNDLITVIELLSPTNKYAGPDREQYLTKRRELLRSRAHFVEIDLLRGGPRMPPDELPTCDYCAIVSRVEERPQAGVWPWRLRDPIPLLPIPLRATDAEARLDLKAAIDQVYDVGRYGNYIYNGPPEPRLTPDDAAWAAVPARNYPTLPFEVSPMPATATQTLTDRYTAAFAGSKQRFETAKGLFPCGVTHDARMMDPFPIYVTHAKGAHKWDVDGHKLTDYFVGHGSHLLGHCPDDVVKAVQEQMAKGTHYGSCHDLEIEWGQLVRKLIPSAERIRFTGSGTEATLMALRLSRLYTGRPKFLKFHGHFHGWHDYVAVAADYPYDAPGVPGVPDEVAKNCVAIPPNDINRLEDALKADPEIGAVILEPTGGHWGTVPMRGPFLKALREVCSRHNRLLIFDEVITGFRVAPGGAQAFYGVTPDMTSMAKILAGGLPGGCLAGRADILAFIEPRPGKPKMKHPGTYNANPLSASAGVATLKRVATGEPCDKANAAARRLRNGLNELFKAREWPWVAYGDFSMVRVVPGYRGERPSTTAGDHNCLVPFDGDVNKLDGPKNMKQFYGLRQAMLLNGVDWWGFAGMTSCEHTDVVIDHTLTAFETSIEMLTAEGLG